jgi:hypothetical protein
MPNNSAEKKLVHQEPRFAKHREQISNQGLCRMAIGEMAKEAIDQMLNKAQAPSLGILTLPANFTLSLLRPRSSGTSRREFRLVFRTKNRKPRVNTVKVNAELQLATRKVSREQEPVEALVGRGNPIYYWKNSRKHQIHLKNTSSDPNLSR